MMVLKHFLYPIWMWEAKQWWPTASTISSCHHFIVVTLAQNTNIRANKGVSICLSIAYDAAQTFFIYPI
jgi:hypothetical protein